MQRQSNNHKQILYERYAENNVFLNVQRRKTTTPFDWETPSAYLNYLIGVNQIYNNFNLDYKKKEMNKQISDYDIKNKVKKPDMVPFNNILVDIKSFFKTKKFPDCETWNLWLKVAELYDKWFASYCEYQTRDYIIEKQIYDTTGLVKSRDDYLKEHNVLNQLKQNNPNCTRKFDLRWFVFVGFVIALATVIFLVIHQNQKQNQKSKSKKKKSRKSVSGKD